jgi:hypothetical protein
MNVFQNNVRRIGCVNIVFVPPALSIFTSSPSMYRTSHLQIRKQLPFLISMCILRDLAQLKNPRGLCRGSSANFSCSHNPTKIISFLGNMKESRKQKRELFTEGEVAVLVRSPEVREHH